MPWMKQHQMEATRCRRETSDTTDISAAEDSGFPPLHEMVCYLASIPFLMVLGVSVAIMVPLIFGMLVCYIQRS